MKSSWDGDGEWQEMIKLPDLVRSLDFCLVSFGNICILCLLLL